MNRSGFSVLALTVLSMVCLGLVPEAAAAQEDGGKLRLDLRGGAGIPIGDLKDYNDLGAALGAGVGYRVAPRWWVRLDYETERLPGADWANLIGRGAENLPLRGPETDFHHVMGNVQFQVTPPGDEWRILGHAGAGVTMISADDNELTGEGGDFERLTFVWGGEIVRPLSETASLVARGDYYIMLSRDAGPSHLGKEFVIPFTLGVRLQP